MLIMRKDKDHDPIRPWMFCDGPLHGAMEVLSYPILSESDDQTLMVRTTPGDPSTLREVPLENVSCFNWDRYGTREEIEIEFPLWTGNS